jgi:hypothetical protein
LRLALAINEAALVTHSRRPTVMTPSTLCLPEVASRGGRLATLRAADWLSLGAAPTFALMAALTGIFGGAYEMLCSAAPHTSALGGMVSMYVLMSVFHLAPWLKLISPGRSDACAAGAAHGDSM